MQFYCDNFKYGDIKYPTNEMKANCQYVCFASFDGAVDDDIENAYAIEVEKNRTGNNPQHRLINAKITDVLTFDIILMCMDDGGVTLKDERDIIRAMTNYDTYQKLTIQDNHTEELVNTQMGRMFWGRYADLLKTTAVTDGNFNANGSASEEIYFNAICTNTYTLNKGGVVRGFKFTFECDSPYAWQDFEYNIKATTDKTLPSFKVNTDSDDRLNRIYPKFVGTRNSSEGELSGENLYPVYDNWQSVDNNTIYTQKGVNVANVEVQTGNVGKIGINRLALAARSDMPASTPTKAAWIRIGAESNNYGCINIKKGKNYIVSFYAKYDSNLEEGNYIIDLYAYERKKAEKIMNEDEKVNHYSTYTVTSDWQRYHLLFTATSGYSYLSLRVGVETPGGIVHFDGFMIEEVPSTQTTPSDYQDYNGSTGVFNIWNNTNRSLSSVSDIDTGDIVTIDSKNSLIGSKNGKNYYPVFNKQFVWLDPSKTENKLQIRFYGDVKMTYSLPRKVGT